MVSPVLLVFVCLSAVFAYLLACVFGLHLCGHEAYSQARSPVDTRRDGRLDVTRAGTRFGRVFHAIRDHTHIQITKEVPRRRPGRSWEVQSPITCGALLDDLHFCVALSHARLIRLLKGASSAFTVLTWNTLAPVYFRQAAPKRSKSK